MENKPGILYVTHETDVNGASKSLCSLIKKIEEKYDIHVLVRAEGGILEILKTLKCNIIIKPYYLDVEPVGFNNTVSRMKWLVRVARYKVLRNRENEKTVREMVQYVKDNNISLIHTNSSSTFIGIKIAKGAGIPHIWHFREFLEEDFNLRPMIGWNSFYQLASTSEKIICVSKSVLQKYKNHINTDMVCIYNGLETVQEIPEKTSHKEINLLQAGVLSAGKGTDIAVKAVRLLHETGYTNVHLFLAGRGNLDFCKDDYQHVSEYVHLLGYVKDLPQLRKEKNIDIELVCSKSEAFGRGTIEAMAFGNAVIGSDSSGTQELVQDHITGLLFKQGNAQDLASKILLLINNPGLIREFGENGHRVFLECYTIDKCVDKIEAAYRNLITMEGKRDDKKK